MIRQADPRPECRQSFRGESSVSVVLRGPGLENGGQAASDLDKAFLAVSSGVDYTLLLRLAARVLLQRGKRRRIFDSFHCNIGFSQSRSEGFGLRAIQVGGVCTFREGVDTRWVAVQSA